MKMPNAPVQAAAEGLPNINRREALKALIAGAASGALTASVVAATSSAGAASSDPLLDLVELYRSARDAVAAAPVDTDEELEALFAEAADPLFFRLRDDPPAATTEAGALAALRLAWEEMQHSHGSFEASLTGAALAYFEGRA